MGKAITGKHRHTGPRFCSSNLWPSGTTDPHCSMTFINHPRLETLSLNTPGELWCSTFHQPIHLPTFRSSSAARLFYTGEWSRAAPPVSCCLRGAAPLAARQYWLRYWSNSHFVSLLLEVAMTSGQNRKKSLIIINIIICQNECYNGELYVC